MPRRLPTDEIHNVLYSMYFPRPHRAGGVIIAFLSILVSELFKVEEIDPKREYASLGHGMAMGWPMWGTPYNKSTTWHNPKELDVTNKGALRFWLGQDMMTIDDVAREHIFSHPMAELAKLKCMCKTVANGARVVGIVRSERE